MQMAAAAHSIIMQQAQLRRMEVWPWSLTLKAQLGLGHVELSEKYDRHYTRTCGGRVVTVGDLQRHAVGGVQLRLQSWDPMSPHPVQSTTSVQLNIANRSHSAHSGPYGWPYGVLIHPMDRLHGHIVGSIRAGLPEIRSHT